MPVSEADRLVHSETPLNWEPPAGRLCASVLTPASLFYVRCHGDIPPLDPARHVVRVGGRVARALALTVPELRACFAPRQVTAVMQCAGNRRADFQAVRPTLGDPWGPGAIGNAEWAGVALADVLQAAGAAAGDLHVAFDACDGVAGGTDRYGVSIPLAKALSSEVLLAYEMNGEPLTPEHGAPVRVVVPGYAGVRSVKWLARITVQDAPSGNPMQAQDYRLFPPDVTQETADWARGRVINEMPVTSAICDPAPSAVVTAGLVALRGYAVAAGGVARVEVSPDGGMSWREADLDREQSPWGWRLWSATVVLPAGRHVLAVRAFDASGRSQPAGAELGWNFKGYLCTAWHRVTVVGRQSASHPTG